jgi:hypothetical protein
MADDKFIPSKPSQALMDIDMAINGNGGCDFLTLRFTFEKWEKEAKEGNASSQQLMDMLFNLDKLLKVILKGSKGGGLTF